ncbi:hypothetical protein H2248_002850 [Termitomyces sp. 'cryptogamus']|nr:hypothetical protein H2248_002850 [Termitomyces sp. 'cryptogamus']
MLALPNLIDLCNVHNFGGVEGIIPVLRALQTCTPRLRGLLIDSPDRPTDFQFKFKHLTHFSDCTSGGTANQVQAFLAKTATSCAPFTLITTDTVCRAR